VAVLLEESPVPGRSGVACSAASSACRLSAGAAAAVATLVGRLLRRKTSSGAARQEQTQIMRHWACAEAAS
jgi:hypothetical protein